MLTALDTELEFSQQCEAIGATSQGCLIRSPRPLQKGTPVRLESLNTGRSIMGRVVFSASIENEEQCWRIGIAVERGELPIVLADDQNHQPQAATFTQDANAEATIATSSTPAGAKSPPLPAAPAKDPETYSTPTSDPLKTPTERPSTSEILKLFEQRIRQKLETVSRSFEAGLQQQAAEILNRTQAELESKVSSHLEHLRSQAEASRALAAQLHEQSEGQLHHWRTGLQDIEAKWEEFRKCSSVLENRTAEVQRNIEEADRQITQRVQEYNASIQERLTEATEQIRGHVRAGVEMAQNHIESSGREVLTQIEDSAKKSEELVRRLDEAGVRLEKLAGTTESTLEKSMLKLTVETLERLQKEIDDRIQRSAAQLESTLAKAMESFCGVLRDSD